MIVCRLSPFVPAHGLRRPQTRTVIISFSGANGAVNDAEAAVSYRRLARNQHRQAAIMRRPKLWQVLRRHFPGDRADTRDLRCGGIVHLP